MSAGRAIVVGLDGSSSSAQAVVWAAREALRRDCGLVLAHAGDTGPGDAFGTELVTDAVAKLVELDLTPPISSVVRPGPPADLLLEQAATAQVLVLGRGRNDRTVRLGSVADRVLAHAPCPVVVLGADADVRTPEVIVVGGSNSPGGCVALDFAVAQASAAGAELRIVRSWSPLDWQRAAGPTLPLTSMDDWRRQEQAVVDELVDRARRTAPALTVTSALTAGSAQAALETAAQDASLVVVGCRHHAGRLLPRLGPVSSWAAHHLHCPVAVVGYEAADGVGAAAGGS